MKVIEEEIAAEMGFELVEYSAVQEMSEAERGAYFGQMMEVRQVQRVAAKIQAEEG